MSRKGSTSGAKKEDKPVGDWFARC